MARGLRTIFLVVAVSAASVALPSSASGSVVDDLIGLVSGSGSEPTPPQSSPPPQKPAPDAGGPLSQPVPPSNQSVAPERSCPGQDDPTLPPRAQAKAMVCMLSFAREGKGRSPLRPQKQLHISATHKARDIRHCQRLSHTACGRDPFYWFQRVGFFRGTWEAGEILAVGNRGKGTVQGTVRRWLGSKPHRAILFHPRFDLVGVGTVGARFRGVRHMHIWVAHFGFRR